MTNRPNRRKALSRNGLRGSESSGWFDCHPKADPLRGSTPTPCSTACITTTATRRGRPTSRSPSASPPVTPPACPAPPGIREDAGQTPTVNLREHVECDRVWCVRAASRPRYPGPPVESWRTKTPCVTKNPLGVFSETDLVESGRPPRRATLGPRSLLLGRSPRQTGRESGAAPTTRRLA